MTIEYCNFATGGFVLEHGHELANFKIGNYIPGAKVHMNPKFTFDITVDETPRVQLQEIILAMSMSVQAVRENFEKYFGVVRQ
jgi:hypothetical protein